MSDTVALPTTKAHLPRLGLGTYKVPADDVGSLVYAAIQKGYRHIDCAAVYGNEKEIGDGLQRALKDGIVKREDLFITSKLWSCYHAKEHVELACRKSLEDLKLSYLDLYLIHWPIATEFVPIDKQYPPDWSEKDAPLRLAKVPLRDTWEAMETLVNAKLVKHIGLSNFDLQILQDLLTYCKIPPSVNQVECHPYLSQLPLLRYCESEHIVLTAYCPLARGAGGKDGTPVPLDEPVICAAAKRHGKTPAQVILRWEIQRSPYIAVIPKTARIERLDENKDIFDFTLSEEDMAAIEGLNANK